LTKIKEINDIDHENDSMHCDTDVDDDSCDSGIISSTSNDVCEAINYFHFIDDDDDDDADDYDSSSIESDHHDDHIQKSSINGSHYTKCDAHFFDK